MPLIQILLGIGIGLCLPNNQYHLDTELFLALVIGPLLFREAQEADTYFYPKTLADCPLLDFSSYLYLSAEHGGTRSCPLG